ncbi:MAG: hypothetical protein FGM38_01580 [Solirubrobacterales bacterium]|nr:hypothetical protein [Solirubrobacterales bacterium]
MSEEEGTVDSPQIDGDELRAAVERLAAGDRLAEAEQMVSTALPELRVLLAEALGTGGWFGEPHQSETLRVATIPDPDERLEALRNLLEEETNIGMMVGVAVGWALRAEIDDRADDQSATASEGA